MSRIASINPLMSYGYNKEGNLVISTPMSPSYAFKEYKKATGLKSMNLLARINLEGATLLNRYDGKGKTELTGFDHLLGGERIEDGSYIVSMFIDSGTTYLPVFLGIGTFNGKAWEVDLTVSDIYKNYCSRNFFEEYLSTDELLEICQLAFSNFDACFKPREKIKVTLNENEKQIDKR